MADQKTQVMAAQDKPAEKVATEVQTYTFEQVKELLTAQDAKHREQTEAAVKSALEALTTANPHIRAPHGMKAVRQATTHREQGDVKVRVVKDLNRCRIGNRVYDAPVGSEMWMNPGHAYELTTGVHEKDPPIMTYK